MGRTTGFDESKDAVDQLNWRHIVNGFGEQTEVTVQAD